MKLIILIGPTASGKSDIGLTLKDKYQKIQIINSDSKQVYKEIPIISAQPSINEITKYNHLLYGYRSIFENYDVQNWVSDCLKAIENSLAQNKIPFLIGGTGFYINALLNGLDPFPKISDSVKDFVRFQLNNPEKRLEIYKKLCEIDPKHSTKININDSYRLEKAVMIFFQTGKSIFEFHSSKKTEGSKLLKHFPDLNYRIFSFIPSREELYKNIDLRFDLMIEKYNMIEEIEKIKKIGVNKEFAFFKAHGIPEVFDFLDGLIDFETMKERAKKNTRNYAKRQITWIKNQMQSKVVSSEKNEIIKFIENFLLL